MRPGTFVEEKRPFIGRQTENVEKKEKGTLPPEYPYSRSIPP